MIRARRAATRLLLAMMVASVTLPAILFAVASWLNFQAVNRTTDERIERDVAALHEEALKVFQSIDLAIRATNQVLDGLSDEDIRARERDLHERLKRMLGDLSQVESLWVFARDGRPLVTSSLMPVPRTINNLERDYFQAHLTPTNGTYIGQIVVPRIGNRPIFTVSQRRPSEGLEFAGVTAAALIPSNWTAFYAQLARGQKAYFALLRQDGTFLARFPSGPQPNARLDENSVVRRMIAAEPNQGIFNASSQLDGIERRIGYRKVAGYPVYVLAGTETAAITAEWWALMASYLVFGLPATALLFAVLGLALHRTRRLYVEAKRREAAEDALRQSQKMEAVGHLTGGIAHDFNNLLTVVIGNLELAERSFEPKTGDVQPRQQRFVQNALSGAQRAASLTQRLLAFSRRQPLKPEPLNSNNLLSGMSDLLHRTLGECIRVEIVASAGLWFVEVDRVQLESAILNLAVNARDAMPEGGTLTLETSNVLLDDDYCKGQDDLRPGQYVLIAVSDSGVGMAPSDLARAFEPFFTTKAPGQGTGLGLSQVFGFVKQSGGHATIYSELRQGTTVKLYLPRLFCAPDLVETAEITAVQGGAETILVVEDNTDVRAYVVEVLRGLEYQVLEASDAEAALRILDVQGTAIALLLTDVILPGMNGRLLADEAIRRQTHIKVLFMTGYSRNAIVHQGKLDPGVELLQKPLTHEGLARKVRAVLDSDSARRLVRA